MTISLDRELADYLRQADNVSAVVAEAVETYRAQKLDERLADAYREDADESERLNRQWEGADAQLDAEEADET